MKDELTIKECVNKAGLDEALSQYMQKVQYLDPGDMKFILCDFQNPEICGWIWHEYLMACAVDGRVYKAYTCWTNFAPFGVATFSDNTRFKFYMLDLDEDPSDYSDDEREMYERLYVVDPIDQDDFPAWTD